MAGSIKNISPRLAWLCLFLLCSCVTEHSRPKLPADLTISKDAGRGGFLMVALRLDSGEELPFVVDTGSPVTLFDKSFEPKLGARLGSGTATNFEVNRDMDIYAAPRLVLGGAPLIMTSNRVAACDFSDLSAQAERPIMGILGMNCLEHYCIQLDFEAGKMRFLNGNHLSSAKLGKAYPLEFSSEGQDDGTFRPFLHSGTLIGDTGAHLMVDTGCNIDGGLKPQLFQQEVREHKADSEKNGHARFSGCVWNGGTYSNIYVRTWATNVLAPNLIGLGFLARHLVTFDFPNRTLYLKQTSVGPLPFEDIKTVLHTTKYSVAKAVIKLCEHLKKTGQLPGWSKSDQLADKEITFSYHYPDSVTFKSRKKGDSSIYHYEVARASEDSPWKLQKAWRADKDDHTVEEYPLP